MIDSNVLIGRIFPDDPYAKESTNLFRKFKHDQIEVVGQVINDVHNTTNKEANAILEHFRKYCSLKELQKCTMTNPIRAKDIVRGALDELKRKSGNCHEGIKKEVEMALYGAIDEKRINSAIANIAILLRGKVRDLISGCLGHQVLGTTCGYPSDAEADIEEEIQLELAGEIGSFGKIDDSDRRILAGLVLECHHKSPITFYTFDVPFFEGYVKFWEKDRPPAFEPARQLKFVLLKSKNNPQEKQFLPSSRKSYQSS